MEPIGLSPLRKYGQIGAEANEISENSQELRAGLCDQDLS